MKWTEDSTGLTSAAEKGGGIKKVFKKLIQEFDITTVSAQEGPGTRYGCSCGSGKTKRAKGGKCCEYESARIDIQRKVTTGKTQWIVYNLQYGAGSYAAINVQAGVIFSAAPNVENLKKAMQHSINNRVRVWVGDNAAGRTAIETEKEDQVTVLAAWDLGEWA